MKPRRFTRRSILRNAALGAVAILAPTLRAYPDSGGEGPKVWLDMDQAALDKAYTQTAYAPNMRQVIARWGINSDAVRSRLGEPLRYSYGDKPIESLDVYPTKHCDAPVHIYIHGGAWRQSSAQRYGFLAEPFVNAGAHFIAPDFSWVQDAGGSLFPLADQVRRAVAWVHRNAQVFGGDADRIYLSGHSSGGHLAGVILTTDWQKEFNLPANIIKGGLCCSGMFDLKPVRLSLRSDYIKFTDEMEHDLSPIRHLEKLHTPLIVAYGSLETPEFMRQSRDFAKAVSNAGKPVQLIVAENYNHFEIIETLASPYGILGRAVLEQMQLDA